MMFCGFGGTYIRGVGDELAEEDLLVGVEGVDDEQEQLVDLGLKGEGLHLRRRGCRFLSSVACRRRLRLEGFSDREGCLGAGSCRTLLLVTRAVAVRNSAWFIL